MRRVNLEQFRETVVSRIMKGDAFLLSTVEYNKKRERLSAAVGCKDEAQIRALWPHHCWGMKIK